MYTWYMFSQQHNPKPIHSPGCRPLKSQRQPEVRNIYYPARLPTFRRDRLRRFGRIVYIPSAGIVGVTVAGASAYLPQGSSASLRLDRLRPSWPAYHQTSSQATGDRDYLHYWRGLCSGHKTTHSWVVITVGPPTRLSSLTRRLLKITARQGCSRAGCKLKVPSAAIRDRRSARLQSASTVWIVRNHGADGLPLSQRPGVSAAHPTNARVFTAARFVFNHSDNIVSDPSARIVSSKPPSQQNTFDPNLPSHPSPRPGGGHRHFPTIRILPSPS
jgi:hypothetical protein